MAAKSKKSAPENKLFSSKSHIYVLGYEGGPYKIGYGYDPTQRLLAQKRRGHAEIYVVGSWPVGTSIAMAAERFVHWKLRDKHHKNEWFNVTFEEAKAAIELALSPGHIGLHDPYDMIPPVTGVDKGLGRFEFVRAQFKLGTKDRMRSVLFDSETMAAFIREAVEAELLRRREKKPPPAS